MSDLTLRQHLEAIRNRHLPQSDEAFCDECVNLFFPCATYADAEAALAILDKAPLNPSCLIGWVRLLPDPPESEAT